MAGETGEVPEQTPRQKADAMVEEALRKQRIAKAVAPAGNEERKQTPLWQRLEGGFDRLLRRKEERRGSSTQIEPPGEGKVQ